MKLFILYIFSLFLVVVSCKKDHNKTTAINTPVPFLTGKKWTADTLTIIPPQTYNQLSASDQQAYNAALGWWAKHALITINENGSVTCGGDYVFGYVQWRMINNNTDIEVISGNGRRDTLFNWTANSLNFTYRTTINQSFNCTAIYK
jgi:hypothetical protein